MQPANTMKPADVLYEMQAIRKTWKDNDFQANQPLNRRYCELLEVRRERVAEYYKNGQVATGSQTPALKAKEAKRLESESN